MSNITTSTDAYKLAHWKAIHPDLDGGKWYMEPRVGAAYSEICYFGLSMILQDHFTERVTEQMIKKGERRAFNTFGVEGMYNTEVWRKVKDLGYLPMRIKAVPEGTIVPAGNVLMMYEPTEPWFAKTINCLESLLMHTRYPTDICSRALKIKKSIIPYFDKSSDIKDLVLPYTVNDFGDRGTTGDQASKRAGAAFMVHFAGSDNEPGMDAIEDYYGLEDRLKSVWATEHSVQLSFPTDLDYVIHQLLTAKGSQTVSIVMDGRDQDAFATEVICHPVVIELVKLRASQGGTTVWRPDSGKPIVNVCKYSDIIGACYGFSMNQKTYKKLNHSQAILQGDGMNEDTIPELFKEYIKTGWAADNILVGSGGGLLQENTSRDLNRWAIKPCQMSKKGVWEDVSKMPKTDMTKASKRGDLKLHNTGMSYMTIESSKETPQQFKSYIDSLQPAYENGVVNKVNFLDVIKRATI